MSICQCCGGFQSCRPQTTCSIPVRRPDGTASQVKLCVRRSDPASANGTNGVQEDCLGVTKDYLDHHHLQQRVQGLIQDVLRDQPLDPYRYMMEALRKVQAERAPPPEQKDAEAEPLVPKPPAKPKPTGSRPAPGRNINPSYKVAVEPPPNKEGWSASKHAVRLILESPRLQKVAADSRRSLSHRSASIGEYTPPLARSETDDKSNRNVELTCNRKSTSNSAQLERIPMLCRLASEILERAKETCVIQAGSWGPTVKDQANTSSHGCKANKIQTLPQPKLQDSGIKGLAVPKYVCWECPEQKTGRFLYQLPPVFERTNDGRGDHLSGNAS
ncbi:unnamed protein product [Polarella glacialis]|uniref:Uncharacterized protein n=1 Tax=Polarella glacialis TaxID=89957 RepID=A0A813G8Z7_POLGL|nr:unnamed protein product [Polarella glacialis]